MSATREEYALSRVSQDLWSAVETVRLYLTEANGVQPGFEQLLSSLLQADIQRKILAYREANRLFGSKQL